MTDPADYDAGFREGLAEALRRIEAVDVHRCDTWTIVHREVGSVIPPDKPEGSPTLG